MTDYAALIRLLVDHKSTSLLSRRCLSLEPLIKVKRAAGRPKDFEAIAELEQILEERRQE